MTQPQRRAATREVDDLISAEPRVVQEIEKDVKDEEVPPPENVATYYKKLSERSVTHTEPRTPKPSGIHTKRARKKALKVLEKIAMTLTRAR